MALVGEWGFNENTGTTAAPESGSLSITGVPGWGDGHGGSTSSMHVNGSGPSLSPFNAKPAGLTVMLWLRPEAITGWTSILYSPASSTQGLGWLEYDSSGVVDWYSGNDLGGPTITTGEWVHLAITADGTTRSIYHNGVLYGSVAGGNLPTNASWEFGGDGQPLNALVDDLRIYDSALTEAEIVTLMNTPIGGSTPTPGGGSVAGVGVAAAGTGATVRSGASAAGVAIAAMGAGERVESGSGGSVAQVGITATGTGAKVTSGASVAGVGVQAVGSGHAPTEHRYITGIDGRHFTDQHGDPILVRGDAPWTALTDISPADWETWCASRETLGYNAAIVSLVGSYIGGGHDDGRTFDGLVPFVGGDITQPSSAYWARMDTMIATAADHGITLWLYPMDGWNTKSGQVFAGRSTADCQTYGEFVATRYADAPNIVWMLGGDYFAPAFIESQFDACLAGIRSTGDTRPFSIQLGYEVSWSTQSAHWAPIVTHQFVYSYLAQYDAVTRAWDDSPVPALFSEGHYEGERDGSNTLTLRKQIGWALTSGSPGDISGTSDWQFNSGWKNRLDTAAQQSMKQLRDTFETIDGWWNLEPAPDLITSGAGTRVDVLTADPNTNWPSTDDYASAAVSADGSLAVVYLPTQRTITLDGAQIGDSPSGTWIDASTGATTAASLGSLTPPSSGDWLLVIEATPVVDVRTGGSVADIGAAAVGTGHKATSSGSAAGVHLTATGTGHKVAGAGSVAPLTLTTITAAGSKLTTAGSHAAATVTGVGEGRRVQSGQGGSTTGIGVSAVGHGVAYRHGSSVATVQVQAVGSGQAVEPGRGGSVAPVRVTPTGTGAKTGRGGSAASVGVSAVGEGRQVVPRTGGSVATLTLTTQGTGRKVTAGGSVTALTVTSHAQGYNPDGLRDITFTLGPLRTHPLTLTPLRRR